MTARTRVFIADDHPIVCEGLIANIEDQIDMEVVGISGDGFEVLRRASKEDWDVLILDLSLPNVGEFQIIETLRRTAPGLKILIYTQRDEDGYALNLLQMGVSGFVWKGRKTQDVINSIRTVALGERAISAKIATLLLDNDQGPAVPRYRALSEREYEILVRYAAGDGVTQIATSLDIAPSTVTNYLSRIRTKLTLSSNNEIIQYAVREGLV